MNRLLGSRLVRHQSRVVRSLAGIMAAMGMLMVTPVAHAADPVLKPYVARYHVKYRGLSGGDIEFTLKQEDNGHYRFSSQLFPNFIGSLFASDEAHDVSDFELVGQTIRPLQFRSEDGTSKTEKDLSCDFDWDTHQAKGVFKDRPFTLALKDGVQDRLTVQLAASLALQAGREPGMLSMYDRDEVNAYRIMQQGKEHISVAAGEFDTVVLKSERDNSSRVTRYWYAGKLNFIPVRAERLTKGKVDIVMELKSYKAL